MKLKEAGAQPTVIFLLLLFFFLLAFDLYLHECRFVIDPSFKVYEYWHLKELCASLSQCLSDLSVYDRCLDAYFTLFSRGVMTSKRFFF